MLSFNGGLECHDDYNDRREEFGGGEREPKTWGAEERREEEEGGDDEDESAQQGIDGGASGAFDALVVAYADDIDDGEEGANGEIGESLDAEGVGGAIGREEDAGNLGGADGIDHDDEDAATYSGQQGQTGSGKDAFGNLLAIAEGDDGLGALRDAVGNHEDDGRTVACHGEGCYAVFAEVLDKLIVADDDKHRDGQFADEGREPQSYLVSQVAEGKLKACGGELERIEPQCLGERGIVTYADQSAEAVAGGGGDGGTLETHVEREDEKPVEEDVEECRRDVDAGCQSWLSVEAHCEETCLGNHAQGLEEGYPEEVVLGKRHKALTGTKESAYSLEVGKDEHCQKDANTQASEVGLCDVDACRLRVLLCKMNACHDTAADAEHQSDAGDKHIDGGGDVDGCQRIASDTVTNEGSVGDVEHNAAHHAEKRGDKHASEQFADGEICKVYCVAIVVHL